MRMDLCHYDNADLISIQAVCISILPLYQQDLYLLIGFKLVNINTEVKWIRQGQIEVADHIHEEIKLFANS